MLDPMPDCQPLKLKAPAKINLSLRILGKREDGFHEIDTLMTPLELHDELRISPAETFSFHCSDPTLPTNADNLVVRAARLFADKTGWNPTVRIDLEKRIPHGAGLAGGSSNASAALNGLNQLSPAPIPETDLMAMAAEIGSDVPFFLQPSPARCQGRGEIVVSQSLPEDVRDLEILLVKPPFGVSTPQAYRAWADSKPVPGLFYEEQKTPCGNLVNDLERPVFAKYPILGLIKDRLRQSSGALAALMSGSGSTLFGLFDPGSATTEVESLLREEFGSTLWICRTRMAAAGE